MQQTNSELKTTDGLCELISFYPRAGTEQFPAVMIYMDAFGIRPALIEMARHLSSQGYFVLLPNLFYRKSKIPVIPDLPALIKPEHMPPIFARFKELIPSLTPEFLLSDAKFFLEFLKNQENARPGKVAVVGYCFGAAHAVRTAAHFPETISAVASFHGGNLASESPQSPHLLIPKIKAELYFAHADQDKSMPREQIEKLEAALEEHKKTSHSETYTGAEHGFTMSDTPAFQQRAHDLHWERLLSLLDRNR